MIKKVALFLIKFYQKYISPFFGKNCRFYPSCSQYFLQAIEKYGLLKGCYLGLKRLAKCHPCHPGGIDFP